MDDTRTEHPLKHAFVMPSATDAAISISRVTTSLAFALIPAQEPHASEISRVLGILEMKSHDLRCAFCGDETIGWRYLHPIVSDHRPTGYPASIKNMIPTCAKRNQSKVGTRKHWRDWMTSDAPLSPKSRRIADLEKRIIRLERYEEWAECTPLSLSQILGEDILTEYLSKVAQLVTLYEEIQCLTETSRKQSLMAVSSFIQNGSNGAPHSQDMGCGSHASNLQRNYPPTD